MESIEIKITDTKSIIVHPTDMDRLAIVEIKDSRNYMQTFVNETIACQLISALKEQFGI